MYVARQQKKKLSDLNMGKGLWYTFPQEDTQIFKKNLAKYLMSLVIMEMQIKTYEIAY